MRKNKRIDAEPARNVLSKKRRSNVGKGKDQDFKLKWEFCGRYDTNFAEEDVKDLHYLEDCPKLTSWPGWELIIEKIQVNNHLLHECEKKDNYSQWEKWNKAIEQDKLEEHIAEWS